MTCCTQHSLTHALVSVHGRFRIEFAREDSKTHHSAVCDQTNQSKWRDQAETDNKRVTESLEIVLVQTCVHDKQEYRGNLCGARKGVLDCGVFWQEFSGKISVRDILVVRGEGIALQTEWTDP